MSETVTTKYEALQQLIHNVYEGEDPKEVLIDLMLLLSELLFREQP